MELLTERILKLQLLNRSVVESNSFIWFLFLKCASRPSSGRNSSRRILHFLSLAGERNRSSRFQDPCRTRQCVEQVPRRWRIRPFVPNEQRISTIPRLRGYSSERSTRLSNCPLSFSHTGWRVITPRVTSKGSNEVFSEIVLPAVCQLRPTDWLSSRETVPFPIMGIFFAGFVEFRQLRAVSLSYKKYTLQIIISGLTVQSPEN